MFCKKRSFQKFRKLQKHLYFAHTCVGVLFYEVASLHPASFLKRDSNTVAFLWSLQNFQEYLFWGISANDCFWRCFIINAAVKNFAIFTERKKPVISVLWRSCSWWLIELWKRRIFILINISFKKKCSCLIELLFPSE